MYQNISFPTTTVKVDECKNSKILTELRNSDCGENVIFVAANRMDSISAYVCKLLMVSKRKDWVLTSPSVGKQRIVFSVSVCLSARISQKPDVQISPTFPYMSPVIVAPSSSDGSAIS